MRWVPLEATAPTVVPIDEENHYDPVESRLLERIERLLGDVSANEPELAQSIFELSEWQVANGKGIEGSLRKYCLPAGEVRSLDGGNADPMTGLIYPRKLEVKFQSTAWVLDRNSREVLARARGPKSPAVRLWFQQPFVMRKLVVMVNRFGTDLITVADIAFRFLELEFATGEGVLWQGAGVSTGWYPDLARLKTKKELERDLIERWKRELEENA